MKLLGLDPGLLSTGWGVILRSEDRKLYHIADGVIHPRKDLPLAKKLVQLYEEIALIVSRYCPDEAAVEATFMSNRNPIAILKLSQAHSVAILAPAYLGIPVIEYTPNLVKKAVSGVGHASKTQVAIMVCQLLTTRQQFKKFDATDALAVAICHAYHRNCNGLVSSLSCVNHIE